MYTRGSRVRIITLSTNERYYNYRPQTKFAEVMFSQVSVCLQGACVARRRCAWQGEHVWWGACMVEGMYGKEVCMAGGCAWQGGVRDSRDGHCSGRYASYWKTFLFKI